MSGVTILTLAGLTLREATRRKVVWALLGLTLVIFALSGWGYSRLPDDGRMTTGELRLVISMMLNLVMFAISLIIALGTAFLAGPAIAGEVESGVALAVLARPVRRRDVLVGKWLGLTVFGAACVLVTGLGEFLIVRAVIGYWPPDPWLALALLALQTVVLLTLALMLSGAISPLASGVVAVGLFGAAWVAGVVGAIGEQLDNESVARVGTISRVILPTDGLWRGAMHALQDPTALLSMGDGAGAFPFLGPAPLAPAYLVWVALWIALIGSICLAGYTRRDV